jgi:hypothetical protein
MKSYMKKRFSINWGKWLREPKQDQRIIEEILRVTKLSKFWTVAAVIIIILSISAGILINYLVGLKSSEQIDASTRQMLNVNKEFIQQSLNAMYPNDFIFKPFEDSQWYTPTPADEYVRLNILPVPGKKISLKFIIKNKSEFPARDVYCMIFFSSKEFVESGADMVRRLKGLDGLNVYTVNSSDDYLDEAAAFEWLSIPPNTQKTVTSNVDLTMKGNTGRLTVRINSINRLVFEFRHTGD